MNSAEVRVVLVAHAPLASALKAVALHIQPDSDVAAVDVDAHWSGLDALTAVQQACPSTELRPTLFLVDVLGATPANAVAQALVPLGERAAAVYGVNVPMLWRTLCYRREALPSLLDRALEGGPMGIGRLPAAV